MDFSLGTHFLCNSVRTEMKEEKSSDCEVITIEDAGFFASNSGIEQTVDQWTRTASNFIKTSLSPIDTIISVIPDNDWNRLIETPLNLTINNSVANGVGSRHSVDSSSLIQINNSMGSLECVRINDGNSSVDDGNGAGGTAYYAVPADLMFFQRNLMFEANSNEAIPYLNFVMPNSTCAAPYVDQPEGDADMRSQDDLDQLGLNQLLEQTAASDCKARKKRYDRNAVPLFLKRNRAPKPSQSSSAAAAVNDDNTSDQDDVIFVGEYVVSGSSAIQTPTTTTTTTTTAKATKTTTTTTTTAELCNILPESLAAHEKNMMVKIDLTINANSDDGEVDGDADLLLAVGMAEHQQKQQRRRRKCLLDVPRRNPKRKVQLEKSQADDELNADQTKGKRTRRFGQCSNGTKVCRRSARQIGAVYRAPSPLSRTHFREWPVEGMHERPEYNPKTGALEKFDRIIRSISGSAEEQEERMLEENSVASDLSLSTHETLHQVLGHAFSVAEVSPLLGETDGSLMGGMKRLLENACILYGVSNEVDYDSVAKYVATVQQSEVLPEEPL